jgi:alpha-tubulin suppressor-like RCC1 family protein
VVGDDESAAYGSVQTSNMSVTGIATGTAHTCAFLANGGLRCWGDNSKGELGYPHRDNKGGTSDTVPGVLPAISFGGPTATAVYTGNYTTCALLNTGEVRCWGWNNVGQLGLGYVMSTSPDWVGGDASHTPDVATATSVQLLPP